MTVHSLNDLPGPRYNLLEPSRQTEPGPASGSLSCHGSASCVSKPWAPFLPSFPDSGHISPVAGPGLSGSNHRASEVTVSPSWVPGTGLTLPLPSQPCCLGWERRAWPPSSHHIPPSISSPGHRPKHEALASSPASGMTVALQGQQEYLMPQLMPNASRCSRKTPSGHHSRGHTPPSWCHSQSRASHGPFCPTRV